MKSSSTLSRISFRERLVYYLDLWRIYRSGRASPRIDDLERDFASIEAYCGRWLDKPFEAVKAVEIGFGSKPYRTFFFRAKGVDLYAMDLDRPIYNGGPGDFLAMARRNGLMRAGKSTLRFWLFDRAARTDFLRAVRAFNPKFDLPLDRLLVGDASDPRVWSTVPFAPDLIYSFLVIMHIEPESLRRLVELWAARLRPGGLVYVTITIYPSLVGNQLPEWYPSKVDEPSKRSEPWEHLRKNRFKADTYLNKLSRRDYVAMFQEHFEVLVDEPIIPGLGRQYLTEEVRRELPQHDEYELLSNNTLFVLRLGEAAAASA